MDHRVGYFWWHMMHYKLLSVFPGIGNNMRIKWEEEMHSSHVFSYNLHPALSFSLVTIQLPFISHCSWFIWHHNLLVFVANMYHTTGLSPDFHRKGIPTIPSLHPNLKRIIDMSFFQFWPICSWCGSKRPSNSYWSRSVWHHWWISAFYIGKVSAAFPLAPHPFIPPHPSLKKIKELRTFLINLDPDLPDNMVRGLPVVIVAGL